MKTPKKVLINGVSIGKHGVRFDGKYTPASYSHFVMISGPECVEIYAKHYKKLPKQLGKIHNESDGMIDYFECDRVRFLAGTKEFDSLLPLCEKW